tara:strand:+ start:601 stop:1020 length:420 start_codon:yes stop_codon:yes gene_type:complete
MVKILESDELPFIHVPRITTRVLCGNGTGATGTTIWEQWIEPDGFIPMHYHDTEEVLVILDGSVVLELIDSQVEVTAPASILVGEKELHGLHPVEDSRVHLFGVFPTSNPRIWDHQGNPRPLPTDDVTTVNNPFPSDHK